MKTKQPKSDHQMKLRSIVPWFGGKRTLAPHIVELLGPHRQYFEPFCGSCAVLLAKPAAKYETVNDLHGELVNLARVLQEETTAVRLYDRVGRFLFSEELVRESFELLADPVKLTAEDRAYHYFVTSWAMRNGVAGTARSGGSGYALALRWNAGGGSPTTRWRSAVDSIPAWHERLRHVVILSRDAFDILEKIPDEEGCTIYLDPPYLKESRTGWDSGAGASSRYEHEFSNHAGSLFPDDHTRLREALARFKRTRWVLSYYDCPRVRSMYQGRTIVAVDVHKQLGNQNAPGLKRAAVTELLICNFEKGN